MKQIFIIKSNQIKDNCLNFIEEKVPPYGDTLLEVIIQEHKTNASLQQRRYLFGYIYPTILDWWKETGVAGDAWDELRKSDAIELTHEWCKTQFITPKYIVIDSKEIVHRTTTSMKVDEFKLYWEEIQRYFAPHGLVLDDPNQYMRKT